MKSKKPLNEIETELLRAKLAKKKDFVGLKKLYSENYPEIKDLNSTRFWNELLLRNSERGYPMYEDKIRSVERKLIKAKGNLLDLGFGNGDLLERLSKNAHLSLYGIEISDHALSKIKKIKGNFRKGTADKIPFGSRVFDHIVALDVLEHIPPSKIFTVLKEIKRVIKKGGTFILSVPINEGLPQMLEKGSNPNAHTRIYTPDLIKAELEIAGFIIKDDHIFTAFPRFYTLKKIIGKYFLKNRWKPNLIMISAVAGKN